MPYHDKISFRIALEKTCPHQSYVHVVAQVGKIMALGGNQSSGVTEFILAGVPNLNSTKEELFSVFLLVSNWQWVDCWGNRS